MNNYLIHMEKNKEHKVIYSNCPTYNNKKIMLDNINKKNQHGSRLRISKHSPLCMMFLDYKICFAEKMLVDLTRIF